MTAQQGQGWRDGMVQGRRLLSPGVRTLLRAITKYGWADLAARAARALRSGGPALLLQKFRQQRALASLQPPAEMRATPTGAMIQPTLPAGDEFHLREDFSLPLAEFTRFVNLWHEHPAVSFLTRGASARTLDYRIVVTPHPLHGFTRLRDTLDFADHLARRAGHRVSVVVHATEDGPLPEDTADPRGLEALLIAQNVHELRAILLGRCNDTVQFLVSGDQICPVFAEVVSNSRLPDFDLVLTDMYFQESEEAAHIVLLPGIDLIHALNADYFLSRAILSARLVKQVLAGLGAFDPHSLIVSALERCRAQGAELRARHVAFPMLRIAETRATIERRRLGMMARTSPLRLPSEVRVPLGRVSIVICTKDNGFLLAQLVENIERTCAAQLADIVVVSNRTGDPHAMAVHARLAAAGRIKLLKYEESFNFSAQSNLGAAAGAGAVLLFLNDDIVPVNLDWLSQLVAPLEDPAIGVVGPLLLYPDQSVQHAGMYLGYNRLAGHTLRGARLPQGDCGFMATAPRRVMAVTGAALAMRRTDFENLGGFDRNLFALHIQDVDLCLRAHFSGLAVVYNPRSVLLHMESVSVRPTLDDPWILQRRSLEHAAFLRRWGETASLDPFTNPNISPAAENHRTLLRPSRLAS